MCVYLTKTIHNKNEHLLEKLRVANIVVRIAPYNKTSPTISTRLLFTLTTYLKFTPRIELLETIHSLLPVNNRSNPLPLL